MSLAGHTKGQALVTKRLAVNPANNRMNDPGVQYDAAGNLIQDGAGNRYEYDAENRMTKATLVSGVVAVYGYDGDGRRVKKSVTQGTTTTVTRFVYGPTGTLVAEYEGETVRPAAPTKEYYYGATGLLAISENGDIKYLTPDHLGTPRVITDGMGKVVSRHDYFPFGEEIGAGIGGRTDGMGFSVDDKVRQKFTGYERDNETGLDFAQARYYEGSIKHHFKSHGAEVGAENVWQYLRKADGFKNNLKRADKAFLDNGKIRYTKDGKYIILDAQKKIISFGNVR